MSNSTVVEITTPEGVLQLLPGDLHTWHYESTQCSGFGSPTEASWYRGEPTFAEADFIYEALRDRGRHTESLALALSIDAILKGQLEVLYAELEDLHAELSDLTVPLLGD